MIVTATKGQWFELPAFRAARVVQKNRNQGTAIAISGTAPTLSPYDENQDIYGILVKVGDSVEIDGVQQGSKVYVFASGEDAILSVNEIDSKTFPDGSFQGTRAVTQQNYTEANVKNGVQYEYERDMIDIPAGQAEYTVFITGDNPVLLKGFSFQFDDSGFVRTEYENPVYTGGTPVEIFNKNYRNPVAPSVTILSGVSVSDVGTQTSVAKRFIGVEQSGNKVVTTQGFQPQGIETLLAPNTTYLFETLNFATSSQTVIAYTTFYEGGTDLPLP